MNQDGLPYIITIFHNTFRVNINIINEYIAIDILMLWDAIILPLTKIAKE